MYWLVFIAGLILGVCIGIILMGLFIGGKIYNESKNNRF